MTFPSSPSNEDLHAEFGRTFKYSSASNSWSSATPDAPVDNTPTTQGYVDTVSLPLTDVVAGSKAFVQEGNKLFIFTGNGWFEIATINTAPTITQGANATYELNADGTPTVITLQATDPEGTPIIWGYQVASGSLEDTTVTNIDNVFTITPGTVASVFNLTFTASDGVNIDTSASSFSLSFGPDWTLTTQQAKIQAADKQLNDNFGASVSIDGDTVVVGANGEDTVGVDSGAAYIFTKTGSAWTQQQKIQASNVGAGDQFGYSVAIDGDTVIIGAQLEDAGGTNAGAAYVFTRSGTTWTEQQKIVASDAEATDYFGYSVSISGDTAVVGARLEDTGGSQAGAAYIFTRDGTTWTEQQKIQASDIQAGDNFGYSVAISGDTVVVSAYAEDTGGNEAGAAYIFTRSGTTWTQQQKIQSSDAEASDWFGISVSISGDTVVVGAWKEDTGGSNAGAAYVFTRSGTTWTQQQKIQASDIETNDEFGASVSISGDTVIVGARLEDTGGLSAGAAYVFTRSGTTWTEQAKIQASDAQRTDQFGNSVAIDGDTVVVAAFAESTGGASAGAAYIFTAP